MNFQLGADSFLEIASLWVDLNKLELHRYRLQPACKFSLNRSGLADPLACLGIPENDYLYDAWTYLCTPLVQGTSHLLLNGGHLLFPAFPPALQKTGAASITCNEASFP